MYKREKEPCDSLSLHFSHRVGKGGKEILLPQQLDRPFCFFAIVEDAKDRSTAAAHEATLCPRNAKGAADCRCIGIFG